MVEDRNNGVIWDKVMDDRTLIQRVQSSDGDAFNTLVDRYYHMVYGVCFRMTGNAADAGELTHDAFVEAYLKIGRLKDPDRIGGWLKTLSMNVCRMWYRGRSRLNTVELDDNMIAADVDEECTKYARMYYGMSKLSPAHRKVLALHYFEGLSYDEIARFLDAPQGTVMSRLHRARILLKEELQQMTEDNDIPEIADVQFKEEIQAEVALLLSMEKGKPSTGKRLRVIFEKSPERLIRLLEDSNEDMQRNIAVALPRLGDRAIRDILSASISSNTDLAQHASAVLKTYISRCTPVTVPRAQPDMASINAYVLLENLIENDSSDTEKAKLLIEWIDACKDSATQVLLVNALGCYQDEAFDLLMKSFTSDAAASSGWVRHALIRTGSRFCREVLNLLNSDREQDHRLGLHAFEGIARSLMHPWIEKASPEMFAHEHRIADRYPPLRVDEIDDGLIERMTEKTSEFLTDEDTEIRNLALNILGHLCAEEYLGRIRACMSSKDQSTRLTAIRVLSGMHDTGIAEDLIARAQNGDDAERSAAVKALGQMSVHESVSILSKLTDDTSNSVRHAAITALGEIECSEAVDKLTALMGSSDLSIRKTTAKAIYGGNKPKKHEPSIVDLMLAEKRRKKTLPVAFISLDAAIRYALPEVRPYDERDLTERISGVCEDYCTARRNLIERGLMTREDGIYEFTKLGISAWNVEHALMSESQKH